MILKCYFCSVHQILLRNTIVSCRRRKIRGPTILETLTEPRHWSFEEENLKVKVYSQSDISVESWTQVGCLRQRWKKYFPFCEPVFWLPNLSAKLHDFQPNLPCKFIQIIIISGKFCITWSEFDKKNSAKAESTGRRCYFWRILCS